MYAYTSLFILCQGSKTGQLNLFCNYFLSFQLKESDVPLAPLQQRIFKIVFVGDSGVGKSSFIHRFCNQTFNPTFSATIGKLMKHSWLCRLLYFTLLKIRIHYKIMSPIVFHIENMNRGVAFAWKYQTRLAILCYRTQYVWHELFLEPI